MDTTEFMIAANIPTKQMVSYYILKGVIEPHKNGKSYEFTQNDVERVLQYKAGDLKIQKKPKQSDTPQLPQPPVASYDLSCIPTEQLTYELHNRISQKEKQL